MKVLKFKTAIGLLGILGVSGLSCSSQVVQSVSDAIEACDGMTYEQVTQQNDITDSCRSAVQSLLPSAENNLIGHMTFLGKETEQGTGNLILYVQGTSSTGAALTAADFAGATVTAATSGIDTVLTSSDFSAAALPTSPDDLASIGVVTDYSGSMSDGDLDDAAAINTDIFSVLPAIYEAEIWAFSDTLTEIQSFTSDQDSVLAAVARNDQIERKSTALYDGMGTALASLLLQPARPIRMLIVATDGLENASTQYTKDQLINTIADNGIVVIMLGALFSDVNEMEELAGDRGIFIYEKTFLAIEDTAQEYVNSLENIVKMTVASANADADTITLAVNGVSVQISL